MEQGIAPSRADVSIGTSQTVDWKAIGYRAWTAFEVLWQKASSTIQLMIASKSSDLSVALNVDSIAARLNVERRGEAEGRAGIPAASEEMVSGTQRDIIAYFRKLHRRAQSRIPAVTDKLRELSEEIDISGASWRVQEIPSRCENDISRLSAEHQLQLNMLREQEAQQGAHYASFRSGHKLDRVAQYPRSLIIHAVAAIALIAIVAAALVRLSAIAVSAAALSTFWAMIISSVTVLAPFLLASAVFRSINHVHSFRRLIGWLGGGIVVAIIGALSLFVAQFMVGTSITGADPLAIVESLLVAPTEIGGDVVAWTALALIVLAGMISFVIGYRADDPYPGYGVVQRAFYQARDRRERYLKRMRKRTNAIVDGARAEVSTISNGLKSQIRHYFRLMDQSKRLPAELADYEVELERACAIVLGRYRAANQSVRGTTTPPASFSEAVRFGRAEEATSHAEIDEGAQLEALQRELAEFDGVVAQARQRLIDLNRLAITSFEDIAGAEGSLAG